MLARSKTFLASARSRVACHDALDPLRSLLLALSARELHLVEFLWRGTRRPLVRYAAVSISWLGNGAAYPIMAVVLLSTGTWVLRPIAAAAASVTIAHLIYPWVKAACARSRPCDLRDSLVPLLASLDGHSFPSGHAMTLSAAIFPIVNAAPATWPGAVGFWLMMAWARIACAHHYPSDTIAGGALGLAIALPVTLVL